VAVGSADSCRIGAQITHGDDEESEARLLESLTALVQRRAEPEPAPPVALPRPGGLELQTVMLPRDAFFGTTEQVCRRDAVGRVAAEILTPYPPGVPAVAPGEVITAQVLDYLATGVAAGMLVPDAVDSSLATLRVVA
jgi:hypothetical protein